MSEFNSKKYQKKVPPKIKSFDELRIPRDFGLALRCDVEMRRTLIGGVALVFLPTRNLVITQRLGIILIWGMGFN